MRESRKLVRAKDRTEKKNRWKEGVHSKMGKKKLRRRV